MNRRSFLRRSAALVVGALAAPWVGAAEAAPRIPRTLYVGPDADLNWSPVRRPPPVRYSTIVAALDAALPGDTVIVRNHTETVSFPLTIGDGVHCDMRDVWLRDAAAVT